MLSYFRTLKMARINCNSFLSRAFSILCWLVISASFIVPMCIVGYVVLPAFSPPRGIVRQELIAEHGINKLCTPAWPDNFDYGVKVYASLELNVINTTKFFESAQLLWHIESVSASKKYPKLASSVLVDIPDMLYSPENRNSALYAHMFIQAADNLLPHPNTHDLSLIYTIAEFVHWRSVAKAVNDTDNFSPEYELVASTKVPWAIYLENYNYKLNSVPEFISKTTRSIGSGSKVRYTYRPPILNNVFTETAGNVKQLALLYSNGTLVSDFDSTTAVQLKLQGIRLGWMRLRASLNEVILLTRSTNVFDTVKLKPKYLIKTPIFQIISETDIRLLLLKQNIASLVTAFVLFICSLTMSLVHLKTWAAFWLGSKPKGDGVSRVTFFIQCSGILVVKTMQYIYQTKTVSCHILIMEITRFLSVFELPYNPLEWSGFITGKIALYKQALVHSSRGGADKDKPEQAITTVRRNVDSTALKWIILVYPPIVVAVVLRALAYSTDGKWGIFKEVVERSNIILTCICFVPQIILNHKARSGSLIPPIIYISYLSQALFFFGSKYSIGLAEIGLPDPKNWILYASWIVFILQWIVYR